MIYKYKIEDEFGVELANSEAYSPDELGQEITAAIEYCGPSNLSIEIEVFDEGPSTEG